MSESRIKGCSVLATIAAVTGSTLLAKYYLYDKKKQRKDEDQDELLERASNTSIVERVYNDVQKLNIWQTLGLSIGLWSSGYLRRQYFKNNCSPSSHGLVSALDLSGGLVLGSLSFGVNAASWFDGHHNQTFGIACILFQIAFLPENVYERFECLFTLLEYGLPVKKK